MTIEAMKVEGPIHVICQCDKCKAEKQERYFCERCGKRLSGGIHTCTPPAEAEKQEPVAHSVVAGALFDFMGWLTTRESWKRLALSSTDEAGPAVDAITEFAKKRGLRIEDAEVGFWTNFLSTHPPQRTWVGLTAKDLAEIPPSCFEGAIWAEAKLKEKNT